jgi:hypothetical protein
MRRSVLLVIATAACAGTGNSATPAGDSQQVVTEPQVALGCQTQPGSQAVAERKSPFDSTRITVGQRVAQVCYGRPSAHGRVIFGAAGGEPAPLVPFDRLWRTGANEPTILHLPFAATVAGIRLEPGSYSLYTVPGAESWTIVVNRSVTQWGHESRYTAEVEAHEVGRATVPSQRLDQHVETFTISAEPTAAGADLVLDWERTRVRIPIVPAS